MKLLVPSNLGRWDIINLGFVQRITNALGHSHIVDTGTGLFGPHYEDRYPKWISREAVQLRLLPATFAAGGTVAGSDRRAAYRDGGNVSNR
ncbi:MAG: hypothetical protein GY711_24990 [bacterium]|nr:hypothetical protein [bacterium]